MFFLKKIIVIWSIFFSQISLADITKIISIHIYPTNNYTRIILESNNKLIYKKFFLKNPKRLVIDLNKVNINLTIKDMETKVDNNDYYIKSIHVAQFNSKTVRIVFTLKQNIKSRSFTLRPILGFKERLILDLYSVNAIDIQDPLLILLNEYNDNNSKNRTQNYYINRKSDKIKYERPIIIMLDPGHGGEDSGAIGKKYFTREKDMVLQIALRLKILIEKENNMRVYMTRDKDIFVPLYDRIIEAKKKHADVVISIHADSFTNSYSRGSSVFVLSNKSATSIAAQYLAYTQNNYDFICGINKSGDYYLDSAIFDMVQSLTISDSLKFGQLILNKLSKINKLHKNKVEQAGFVVLKNPDIPSILIETAFISNLEEEYKLRTSKFQQEIAESILAGIKTYFSERKVY